MNDNTIEICARLDAIAGLLDARQRRVQPNLQDFSFSVAASGSNVLLEGQPGQRIFVGNLFVVAAAAVTICFGGGDAQTFKPFPGIASGTGTAGSMAFSANAGFVAEATYPQFIFRSEPGEALTLSLSGAVQVGGYITYWKA